MRDMIYRQAAIDAVEHITSSMSVCVNTDECHGMKRMQRQAVIELANLPPAQSETCEQPEQPEQQWIPCSERLPKKSGRYNVTIEDKNANIKNRFTAIAKYIVVKHAQGWVSDANIVAWMPLPEPYREEGEG